MHLLTINDFLAIENKKDKKIEKSNFKYAFYLLEKEKRIALSNFYLLCSYLDNIVDNDEVGLAEKKERMNAWKQTITNMYKENNTTLVPLREVFDKYAIPLELVLELVEGISNDLHFNRYNSFDDLLRYCYGVAGVVGLICMHIFTDNKLNKNLEQYAINLGYALQLTNIMRDIGEDFTRNYIYIPQELLTQFNYSEQDIANHIYNENFYNLMNHLYEKAIYYYSQADFYIKDENKNILKASEGMKNIYLKLLLKIKKNNFHIYKKKIKINNFQKLILCLR